MLYRFFGKAFFICGTLLSDYQTCFTEVLQNNCDKIHKNGYKSRKNMVIFIYEWSNSVFFDLTLSLSKHNTDLRFKADKLFARIFCGLQGRGWDDDAAGHKIYREKRLLSVGD